MTESSVVFVSAEIIDKKHVMKQINCQSGFERPRSVRTGGKQWRLLRSGHGRGRGESHLLQSCGVWGNSEQSSKGDVITGLPDRIKLTLGHRAGHVGLSRM